MSNSIIHFPLKKKVAVKLVAKVPSDIRRLASTLMLTVHIQQGTSLVHVLGNGDERTNQQAIETWLMKHYTNNELLIMKNKVETLTDDLSRYLNLNQELPSC